MQQQPKTNFLDIFVKERHKFIFVFTFQVFSKLKDDSAYVAISKRRCSKQKVFSSRLPVLRNLLLKQVFELVIVLCF